MDDGPGTVCARNIQFEVVQTYLINRRIIKKCTATGSHQQLNTSYLLTVAKVDIRVVAPVLLCLAYLPFWNDTIYAWMSSQKYTVTLIFEKHLSMTLTR